MTSARTNYRIDCSREVSGDEITELRRAANNEADLPATWDACVRQSLCVVTARAEGSNLLIGVGFVVGNVRHAELVDISVSADWQRQGVGRDIGERMVRFALEGEGIKFIGLTWDKSKNRG